MRENYHNTVNRDVGAYPAHLTTNMLEHVMAENSISTITDSNTREIICSGGERILVDAEDYPLLSRHPWHFTTNGAGTRGYAVTRLNTTFSKTVRTVFMHNLILGFGYVIDHANQDTKDNRKSNIRNATHQKNGWNKPKTSRCRHGVCTSKYKGVSYAPYKGKPRWVALLKYVAPGEHKSTGKVLRLGYFWNEDDAARAYNAKAIELRGEWAYINQIPGESS